MIAHLHGSIEFVGKDNLIVNVGNVGLRVYVPAATRDAAGVGKIVDLFTHLHIRENEWTLYGFPSQEELEFFELLIGVSGVGARTALAVLGAASPEQLRSAIAHEQAEVLTRVPGIGPKTAKSIIFHLKDKVGVVTSESEM
jgi:Holliday junction DNA helicase RuvA